MPHEAGRRRAKALAMLTFLLAAHGAAAGSGVVYDRIVIRSTRRIDTEALRASLPLRAGVPVTEADLRAARELLEEKRVFRSIEIRERVAPRERILELRLDPLPVILSVSAQGHEALGRKQMRRLIRLRAGQLFDEEAVEAAAERIRRQYRRLGYEMAVVQVEERERDGAVEVVFRIDEGKPVRVAQVEVEGDGVAAEAVSQAVAPLLGERMEYRLDRRAERLAVGALRDLGYYKVRVETELERLEPTAAALRVSFDRGPRYELQVVGDPDFDRDDLFSLMNLRERLVITDGTWRELARRMVRAYQEQGFARAKVTAEIEGAQDGKVVRFVVRKGRRYRVQRVEIAGNRALSGSVLRQGLATRTHRWFPWPRRGYLLPDDVQADRDRIRYLYRKAGYESVKVSKPGITWDEDRGRVKVRFAVDEGPRTVVSQVTLAGFPAGFSPRRPPATRVGEPFDEEEADADRRDLVLDLARLGYTGASVEVRVEREPVTEARVHAHVRFEARPGMQRRVGRVIVQENVTTRDRVLLREVPLRSGDPLNIEALLRAQGRIYRLGLFRSVSVRPVGSDSDPQPDVAVRVVERLPGRLEWGAGFNTRDGIAGFFEIGHRNLGGMAREVSARAQSTVDPTNLSSSQFLLATGFRDPRLRDSPWRFSLNLLAERSTREVDQFSVERANLTAAVDRDLTDRLKVGFEVQADASNIFDVAPDAQLGTQDEGLVRLIGPGPFLVYDARDSSFAPTRGIFDSVRLRYTLPELSTVHLLKLSLQHSQYVPLPARLRFVYALRGGWAGVLTGGEDVPIRERFFLGGRSTVRGFSENSVGPEGEDGNPIGGDLALNVNLELRFPLLFGVEGAVFADGGGAFLIERPASVVVRGGNLSIDNFRRSAGVGLRYMTPVGPLSLDWGFKLDRRGDESIGAIHFNIGTAF